MIICPFLTELFNVVMQETTDAPEGLRVGDKPTSLAHQYILPFSNTFPGKIVPDVGITSTIFADVFSKLRILTLS